MNRPCPGLRRCVVAGGAARHRSGQPARASCAARSASVRPNARSVRPRALRSSQQQSDAPHGCRFRQMPPRWSWLRSKCQTRRPALASGHRSDRRQPTSKAPWPRACCTRWGWTSWCALTRRATGARCWRWPPTRRGACSSGRICWISAGTAHCSTADNSRAIWSSSIGACGSAAPEVCRPSICLQRRAEQGLLLPPLGEGWDGGFRAKNRPPPAGPGQFNVAMSIAKLLGFDLCPRLARDPNPSQPR